MTKFQFKTFNRNISALNAPHDVQSLFQELVETINLHSSVIEDLASATTDSVGLEFAEFAGGSEEIEPPLDDVDRILHHEIFGG